MNTEATDCVVIGAGVVGLAVARQLALGGREVIVLESADAIGTETSSRNSEVIHAGIYYPTGSLKARFCVRGRELMYRYCKDRSIAHRACGKLIVATEESQRPVLEKLAPKALDNGVDDLEWLDADQVRALEPALRSVGALQSPSTGIVDSHGVMLGFQGDAEDAGAAIAFMSPMLSGEVKGEGIVLHVGGDDPMCLLANTVVNAAGLHAASVAAALEGMPAEHVPVMHYAKGNYYTLVGRSPFSRLIYPVPQKAGLGVHVSVDLGGRARFGPDVEWIDAINYDVDPARAEVFYDAVRDYWPGLQDGALLPGYAGVRPKLQAPDGPAADFVVQGPETHGVEGLVNLFGIESPGLTASLAIAEHVEDMLEP